MPPRLNRNAAIVVSVLVFHVLAIWALHTGLLHRAIEVIVPVALMTEIIEAPKPVEAPPPPAPPKPVVEKVQPKPTPPRPLPAPTPQPIVSNDPPPPTAPIVVPAPPAPLPPITAPVAVAAPPAPPAPPPPAPPALAPPRIELPTTDAAYLRNPRPIYPNVSKRLREEGAVLLRVFVSAEGLPVQIELKQTSGFERLDKSALEAVANWRFVPGRRAGVPESMWYEIPVTFDLNAKPK